MHTPEQWTDVQPALQLTTYVLKAGRLHKLMINGCSFNLVHAGKAARAWAYRVGRGSEGELSQGRKVGHDKAASQRSFSFWS